MVLKTDGPSNLDASEDSNCSGGDLVPPENMVHDDVKNIIDGSSSMLTIKPSHHCISVREETGTAVKNLHNSNGCEDIDKLHKFSCVEMYTKDQNSPRSPCTFNQSHMSNKDGKVVGDGILSDKRADGANVEVDHCTGGADPKKLSCSDIVISLEREEAITQTSTGGQNKQHDAGKGSADQLQDTVVSSLDSVNGFAAEDGKDHADQSDNSVRSAQCVEKLDCMNGLALSAEVEKSALPSACEVEMDESDLEEQDVKVCDICGDAGREDLLAICSRCSDGAEHAYCMREMLRKVPEGDWLCEECKMNAELEGKKPTDSEMLGNNEKHKQQGRTNSISGGSKIKNPDLNNQKSLKRRLSKKEIAPPAKRPALDSTVVSKTFSQKGINIIPGDNSFKNIEKMKVKLDHHVLTSTNSPGGIAETPRSPKTSALHGLKGTFGKSNSFSIPNTKPKIKLVDEVPQKLKPVIDGKEGSGKLIAKSMSFKGNMARSSTTESKVKMLSPKFVHISDSKGPRQAKESNSFERKNSSKSDSSFAYQVAANSGKNQLRVHNVSSLAINSSRDYKSSQSLRPSIHLDRASDAPASDSKRNTTASLNGMNSTAENLSGLKDETTVSMRTGEINSQSERGLENALNSRQGGYMGSTSGTSSCSAVDTSARSSKEGINEEDKLKAAIEAAMQKKMDICKRNRVSDKSNELSVSNTDSIPGNASRDRLTKLSLLRNPVCTDEKLEGELASRKFGGHSKQATMNNNSQYKAYRTDPVPYSKERHLGSVVQLDGESIGRTRAIPEHDYIWQGGFEVHRGGRIPVLLKGFQAHISALASYKVLEMAKKLPENIYFNEVPRSSAWPLQFQGCGAKEDNIALYFFAKDLESYERTYKNLISTMMKDDLALKGNIDGVDLLIFPSDQISQKCQRWNMMFYLWGLFRGRRHCCLDKTSGSLEKPGISSLNVVLKDKELGPTLPEASKNPGPHGPSKEGFSTYNNENSISSGSKAPANVDSSILSNGGRDGGGNSIAQACLGVDIKVECNDRVLDGAGLNAQSCSLARCSSTFVKEDGSLDSKMVVGSHRHEEMKTLSVDKSPTLVGLGSYSSCSPSMQWVSEQLSESVTGLGKGGVVDAVAESSQLKLEGQVKQEKRCVHAMSADGGRIEAIKVESDEQGEDDMDVDINVHNDAMDVDIPPMENLADQNFSPKESLHLDSVGTGSVDASARPSGSLMWKNGKDGSDGVMDVQDECICKRLKVTDEWYGDNPSSHSGYLGDHFSPQEHGSGGEAFLMGRESAERYFFPVDSSRAESSSQSAENSLVREVDASGKDDRLPDGSPSLELALGVENRFSKQGGLTFISGIDDKMEQGKPPDVESKKDEEDASASLSLSLAFPFSERERHGARSCLKLRGSPS